MKILQLAQRLALAIALVATVQGCSRIAYNQYFDAISQNQQSLSDLALGMSASDVRRVMGEGELVHYGRIHLVDPWRVESFYLTDGTDVLILYYVTTRPHRYSDAADDDLTPIVLENDKVMGWGWSFLNRNVDRYEVDTPKQQR
jgi:hypothetical protein